MASYTPAWLTSTYPTTADLISLYGSEGIQTGFDYLTAATDPAVFATEAAFFDLVEDQGFFTGSVVRKYYTPEQAAALRAQSFVYNTYTINGIEYRMRVEGIETGELNNGVTCHAPGDDGCTILDNFQSGGYMVGCPDVINTAESALTDHECLDGRCSGTCCVAPWVDNDAFSLGETSSVWTDPGVSTDVDFDCDTNLWFFINVQAYMNLRVYVDSVLTLDLAAYYGGGVNWCHTAYVALDAGPHTISYECDVVSGTRYATIYMMAFKQACS